MLGRATGDMPKKSRAGGKFTRHQPDTICADQASMDVVSPSKCRNVGLFALSAKTGLI
jgi:hypothetical protein